MEKKYFDEEVFAGTSFAEETRDGFEYIECVFRKCDFSYAAFLDCSFEDCVFENCNFSMTKMDRSVHESSGFGHCKIQGVDFGQCAGGMFKVHFMFSSISYSAFIGKKMPKTVFSHCDLKAVDFSSCDLSDSRFDLCVLPDCIFHDTQLDTVDFSSASQYRIDPENNSLKGARFDVSGLSGLLEQYGIVIV